MNDLESRALCSIDVLRKYCRSTMCSTCNPDIKKWCKNKAHAPEDWSTRFTVTRRINNESCKFND